MAKPRISDTDLCRNAKRLRTGVAEIKTFLTVETKNKGFDAQDRPLILFERHHFHRLTRGKYSKDHPDISNPVAGGYGTSASQYGRFSKAFELDPDAAMKSASWGLGQVMGFNHLVAGYSTVGQFVDAMKESEGKQLDAAVNFIIHNDLDDELRTHNWKGFAKGYNGAGYKKNQYDTKLEKAYAKFSSGQQIDCSNVSAADPAAVKTATSHTSDSTNDIPQDTATPDPPPTHVETKIVEKTEDVPPGTTTETTTTINANPSVGVVPAKPSIWTSLTAAGTALYGYYKLAKEDFSDIIDRATGAIDIHFIMNAAVGAGLVFLGMYLYDRSRQRAVSVTKDLIAQAADPTTNNVHLTK